MMQELNEKLNLSPEQQQTVRTLFMEMGQSIRSMREGGMETDQMTLAIDQSRRQMIKKIESILDVRQNKLYREMTGQNTASRGARGNVWVIGSDGAPIAKTVMIGISDGSRTEILSGDIKSGDRIIVRKEGN